VSKALNHALGDADEALMLSMKSLFTMDVVFVELG